MRVIYTSKGMSKKFGVRVIHQVRVIYRKIRYICCRLSSGCFSGVCILYANVSEHTLCSIFRGTSDDRTEYSETSAYKIQTLGNHPKERIKHSEHGESLKSRLHLNCTGLSMRVGCGIMSILHLVKIGSLSQPLRKPQLLSKFFCLHTAQIWSEKSSRELNIWDSQNIKKTSLLMLNT